jgi:hypothetical protein
MENRYDDPAFSNVCSELMDMIRARPDDALQTLLKPVGLA